MRRPLTALLFCSLAAGCAGKQGFTVDYDPEEFAPAVLEPEPARPVELVPVAEAVPLPGQLKPVPAVDRVYVDELAPLDRADEANLEARFEPEKDGYVNAIQVYPYVEGALYQLYTAPEQISNVALQPGETLRSVSAGDTVRWIVGDTTSGAGDAERVHVLVKPTREDIQTNLVITTDRRVYHLELHSTAGTYMASVSWTYPNEVLTALQGRNAAAEEAEARIVDAGVDLDDLNFRYRITGDHAPWAPTRAFDDGHKVYIQFPGRLDQGEAPPLFVVGADGETQLVNYRVRDRYYVVDRLFAAAELRLGEEPQQIVRIIRTDARPTSRHRVARNDQPSADLIGSWR